MDSAYSNAITNKWSVEDDYDADDIADHVADAYHAAIALFDSGAITIGSRGVQDARLRRARSLLSSSGHRDRA